MTIIFICLASLAASGLTFISGFGLGTLLMPVFAIFFPLNTAIAMTAIVHFLNNIFKFILIGRHANRRAIVYFGLPAILAAFCGAALLVFLSDTPAIIQYSFFSTTAQITWVKLVISGLMIFFAIFELLPRFRNMQFDQKYLPLGGLLSGFFGGLSGHQGAMRSAFLIRLKLTKESFVATGVVIACFVDIARLVVYGGHFLKSGFQESTAVITSATLSAFAGAFLGRVLLKKITIQVVQIVISILLLFIAVLLGLGVI